MGEVNTEDLIRELNLAYEEELKSLQNYLSIGVYLEGVYGQGVVAEDLIQDVGEERNHAERLAQRITELDGKPVFSTQDNTSQKIVDNVQSEDDVEEAVRAVIELEKGAVERYKKIIRMSRELGDETTRRLAEDLLADEEEHLDDFEGYLAHWE